VLFEKLQFSARGEVKPLCSAEAKKHEAMDSLASKEAATLVVVVYGRIDMPLFHD